MGGNVSLCTTRIKFEGQGRRVTIIIALVQRGTALGDGMAGSAILILYGIIPTFQTAPLGRVFATYGGMFTMLSLLWGWAVDSSCPDRFDNIGATICLVGLAVIMYAPCMMV